VASRRPGQSGGWDFQDSDIRKVADCACVSTGHKEQQSSYKAQMDYYTSYIKGRDDWKSVSVDERVTGCNTKKRDNFNKMVGMPASPLTRQSTRKSTMGWRSGSTGQRRGFRKPASPSQSGRQSGRKLGGSFPAWKTGTACSQNLMRTTGAVLWNMPRCTAKMTSTSLSRTGWKSKWC